MLLGPREGRVYDYRLGSHNGVCFLAARGIGIDGREGWNVTYCGP